MLRRAFIFVPLLVAGCSNELDRPIRIVLPNDHVGDFTIVKDQGGRPYEVTPEYYVFVIPPSGELRTPDISLFHKWHQLRVEYEDGRVLLDNTRDLYSNHGVRVKNHGTTVGNGTTMRWEVVKIR